MNALLDQLEQRRNQILQQISSIDRLRRGSLSRQFFKTHRPKPKRQGPYFVLQGFLHGQKFSERVSAEQAPAVEAQVANYKRFQQLAEEFVTVTEQMTRLREQPATGKKNSSPKSTMSSSGKPRASSG